MSAKAAGPDTSDVPYFLIHYKGQNSDAWDEWVPEGALVSAADAKAWGWACMIQIFVFSLHFWYLA